MHTIRLSEAEWHRTFVHDWYPLWLDATQLLVVRLWRQSPTRPVCLVRLFVIDTVAGKVVKDSDELQCAGQHLILSPDRTMGLLKPDARRRRQKETDGWDSVFIYAYTYVLNMDRLAFAYSVREPSDGKRRNEDDDCILIAQWSPDGKTVLTVDGVPDPKVKLWEAKSGKLLTTLKGHRDYILDVAWSPAGDKLLTASEDRTVRVWDVPTGKLDLELVGHTAGLNKVMVLRDGRIAVTAAEEPVVRVWDLASGKLSFELPGHDSAVRELEPLSDTLVRTVTLRGTSTTWDCATGRRLDVTPMPPRFPKRFGNCEIVEKGKELQMLTVASTPPGPQ